MTYGDRDTPFARVKDRAGNEFFCPVDALKDPKQATEDEIGNCVDDATVGRYSGRMNVVDE